MLVYEDKLMGKCNLLVESQGEGILNFLLYNYFYYYYTTARVLPTEVRTTDAVLSTNVHLKFDAAVESRVAEFRVEAFTDLHDIPSISIPPIERVVTIKDLEPATTYTGWVIVKYKDGIEVKSEKFTFTTPGNF